MLLFFLYALRVCFRDSRCAVCANFCAFLLGLQIIPQSGRERYVVERKKTQRLRQFRDFYFRRQNFIDNDFTLFIDDTVSARKITFIDNDLYADCFGKRFEFVKKFFGCDFGRR